jgi:hypothetical protein
MKTARINLSLGEKLFSLYFKKIISSLQYKEVHFSSSGMCEQFLASSNQESFFHKNLLISIYEQKTECKSTLDNWTNQVINL